MTNTHTLLTLDTLVSGTHFWPEADPRDVGYKAAMVNLSDIAAMGGEPRCLRVALSHPTLDDDWIAAIHAGLGEAMACVMNSTRRATADDGHAETAIEYLSHQIGPMIITVEAEGGVTAGTALCRGGAQPGDDLFVSGTLGDARYALTLRNLRDPSPEQRHCLDKLNRPRARVALGAHLRHIASACIDVSDGLSSDLAHICTASGLDATISLGALPLSSALQSLCAPSQSRQYAATGGDDYELLFAAPAERSPDIDMLGTELGIAITRIGSLEVSPDANAHTDRRPAIAFLSEDGSEVPISRGFTHFTS